MEKQSQRKSGSYFNNVSLAAMSVCRKNMRKLRQRIIIGFSICIVGFAGTKPLYAAERVAEKPLELSIWYPWTDKYDAYQRTFLETIEEYNKMHTDVHLIAKGMEMEFYREKIATDIASNDVPDIYFCYSDEYMRNIAASGRILNMDPYLKSDMDEKREEFHDSMLYNGERYALGFAESVGVFLVNTDLLQQYQCEIPTDWEDAFQICQIFTDQGRIPFVCSDDSDIGFRMYLEKFCMDEAGAEKSLSIIKGDKKPDQEFKKGVEEFLNFMNLGSFGGELRNTNKVEEDFYMSRIPIYYAKSSVIGNLKLHSNPLANKIKLVNFPGNDVLLGGASECFVINKNVSDPQEAVSTLAELMINFSNKLEENGWAISIYKGGRIKSGVDSDLWSELFDITNETDHYMQYWEFATSGEQQELFALTSQQLAFGQITAEDFIQTIEQ